MRARRLVSLSLLVATAVVPHAARAQATRRAAQTAASTGAASPATAAMVRSIEEAWVAAYVKGDTGTIGRVLGREYVEVGPDGKPANRSEAMQDIASGRLKYTSIRLGDLAVRQYGTVAVVVGDATQKGTYAGKDISGAVRFTDVFVRRGGRWQAVSSHLTMVAQ
jgi:ketosteroid isomerase-like protein